MQVIEIKHQLIFIKIKNEKSIDEYYHKINKLWQKINIFETERIRQFVIILRPLYSALLIGKFFAKMKDFLTKARTIKN